MHSDVHAMTRGRQVLPRAEEYMQGLPLDQSPAATQEAASNKMGETGQELQAKVQDARTAAASPAASTCA
jgi:hypothetical protein